MSEIPPITPGPSQPSTSVEEPPSPRHLHIAPDEELISLAEAARHLPRIDGRKVAISTVWRWCRVGLRGVHLEYVRVGRKICTSREALLRFFAALAEKDQQLDPSRLAGPQFANRPPMTSRRRQRALEQVDQILERARI